MRDVVSQNTTQRLLCSFLMLVTPFLCNADQKKTYLRYTIEFTQSSNTDALAWLKRKGFEIDLDADDIKYRFEENGLVLSTDTELAGIVVRDFDKNRMLDNIEYVEIEWGVNKFPEGANWEAGNNRVAIAAMVFFGDKKISSGLPFGIHAAPYFISPFIGNEEPLNKVYIGVLYKKGGRYINVNSLNVTGKPMVSRIYLKQQFTQLFGVRPVPAVSGFAFQMNTNDTDGGAEAFIKTVKFYSTSEN